MQNDNVIWGIHAGRTGDAHALFMNRKCIAIGWPKMGALNAIATDREAYKKKFTEVYPDKKPGAVPTSAGQLFRFYHEMKIGDLVAYASKTDRHIHIGKVIGEYEFDPEPEEHYPHHRAVQWLATRARTSFSQGALYELGSAMSFFQIKTFADEYLGALNVKPETEQLLPQDDVTTIQVAEDIEDTTRDWIIKQLAKELKGHPFAQFIAHLLVAMGYRTRVSPEGPDGGIDIIAHRDQLGFEPPIVKVQVKSSEGSVGDPVVSSLYGKVGEKEYGLLVTLGTFTAQARTFERSKSNLRLIDGEDLVNLIFEYYEAFDSRYKGFLPLKRVYVPVPIDEDSE